MKKRVFLAQLRARLSSLPKREVEESLNFYSEAIDDRMEEGFTEAEAVAGMGAPSEAAARIIEDVKAMKGTREKLPRGHMKAGTVLLLVLGAPLWLSLFVALLTVGISLFAGLWSVVVSLWAVFAAITVSAPAGLIMSIYFIAQGNAVSAGAFFAAALVLAGLAIFAFYGCMALTKGSVFVMKRCFLGLKRLKGGFV